MIQAPYMLQTRGPNAIFDAAPHASVGLMQVPPRVHRLDGTAQDVTALRSTQATRARSRKLLQLARAGRSNSFLVDDERLVSVAQYVANVMLRTQSGAACHGRMRHFDAGGCARGAELMRLLEQASPEERVRAKIDLILPSVLLDAGAGESWSYEDGGVRLTRSEGLAVASYRMFVSGAFAADGRSLRTDAEGLAGMDVDVVSRWFQVTPTNPLVGVAGRSEVLRSLALALSASPEYFGRVSPRPGHLFDWARRYGSSVSATDLLAALLCGLAPIWTSGTAIGEHKLGDVWPHPALGEGVEGLVPFHKLSQWLVYSLVEPFAEGGITITGADALTRLAEYRNGGLLLDAKLLRLRDDSERKRVHHVGDPLIVEWRALTVALLDEITPLVAAHVAARGGQPSPMLIEHGMWSAGREIAAEKRPRGVPPLAIESDGTVF